MSIGFTTGLRSCTHSIGVYVDCVAAFVECDGARITFRSDTTGGLIVLVRDWGHAGAQCAKDLRRMMREIERSRAQMEMLEEEWRLGLSCVRAPRFGR